MARLILFCCLLLNCLGVRLLAEPIRIGLNYPHSGNYQAEGLELHRGALLAVAAINREGGVLGQPLQLLARCLAFKDPVNGQARAFESGLRLNWVGSVG